MQTLFPKTVIKHKTKGLSGLMHGSSAMQVHSHHNRLHGSTRATRHGTRAQLGAASPPKIGGHEHWAWLKASKPTSHNTLLRQGRQLETPNSSTNRGPSIQTAEPMGPFSLKPTQHRVLFGKEPFIHRDFLSTSGFIFWKEG